MRRVKIAKASYIVTSGLILLAGCAFLLRPGASLTVLCRVFGLVLVLSGVSKIFGYFSDDRYCIAFQFHLALGVLTAILGGLALGFPTRFAEGFTVLVAIFVIVDALFTVQNAVEAGRFGIRRWWLLLAGGLAAGAVGAAALANPEGTSRLLIRLAGLGLIADGAQNIVVALVAV